MSQFFAQQRQPRRQGYSNTSDFLSENSRAKNPEDNDRNVLYKGLEIWSLLSEINSTT